MKNTGLSGLLLSISLVMAVGCAVSSSDPADQGTDAVADAMADVVIDAAADVRPDITPDRDAVDAVDDPGVSDVQVDAGPEYSFVEFEWQQLPDDVTLTRMCAEAADPDAVTDKINIHCVVEGESFVVEPAESKADIVVMAYNIERGHNAAAIAAAMKAGVVIPLPDVLLVSEADRGCDRTDNRYVIRDIARELGMYYVYAVEFVELPRPEGSEGDMSATCEHGNGILSRYPLGNVKAIRHAENYDWSGNVDQPRLGGRIAVTADVKVGDSIVNVAAIHFESTGDDTWRGAQAREMVAFSEGLAHPFVIGGDFNCALYSLDLSLGSDMDETIGPFLDAGFFDAHADWSIENRVTHPGGGFLLDMILGNRDMFSDPGMCLESDCGNLSDHLPIWTTVTMPRP